jgi:hypothetical protein
MKVFISAPDLPANVSIVNVTSSSIEISWTAPENVGGGITNYVNDSNTMDLTNCIFSTINFADNSLSNKPRFLERQVLCNYSMNCLKISDLTSINVVCNF